MPNLIQRMLRARRMGKNRKIIATKSLAAGKGEYGDAWKRQHPEGGKPDFIWVDNEALVRQLRARQLRRQRKARDKYSKLTKEQGFPRPKPFKSRQK